CFFFQAEDGIRDRNVTGVQTCALPILSGSGKSTLVRMLNRLFEPSSGDIWLNGKNVAKMNKEELRNLRRKEMSMVFQNFALLPHKTILQNGAYGLEIQGVAK